MFAFRCELNYIRLYLCLEHVVKYSTETLFFVLVSLKRRVALLNRGSEERFMFLLHFCEVCLLVNIGAQRPTFHNFLKTVKIITFEVWSYLGSSVLLGAFEVRFQHVKRQAS